MEANTNNSLFLGVGILPINYITNTDANSLIPPEDLKMKVFAANNTSNLPSNYTSGYVISLSWARTSSVIPVTQVYISFGELWIRDSSNGLLPGSWGNWNKI